MPIGCWPWLWRRWWPTLRGGGRLAAALGTAADVADRGAAAGTAGAADAAAGGSFCPGQLLEWLTLSVIHEVLVSQPLPSDEILDKLNSLLPLFIPVEMVPSPKKLFAPRAVGRLQAAGAYFKALYVRHEAARLAAYEDGSWKAVPPKDILDVLLADVDQPKGAYRGDRLRLAADYMLLFMAGYDTTVREEGGGVLHGLSFLAVVLVVEPWSLLQRVCAPHSPSCSLGDAVSGLPLLHLDWCDRSVSRFPPGPIRSVGPPFLSSSAGSFTRVGHPHPLPPP